MTTVFSNVERKNKQRSMAYLLVVLVQSLFLISMIALKQYTLTTGTPIVLEITPIDPRSLFSGDYVRLNYQISNLSLDDIPGDKNFKMGDTVYVTLQAFPSPLVTSNNTDNSIIDYWKPIFISKTFPETNQVVIRGVATQQFSNNQNSNNQTGTGNSTSKTMLSVWYGIEQFYVPENKGQALEQMATKKQLAVKVKVDKFGVAAIAGLVANGQEIYQEKLF